MHARSRDAGDRHRAGDENLPLAVQQALQLRHDGLVEFREDVVQQQRAPAAVPFLEQAARDESFVEAQLNLGIALQQSGDSARAAAQYRKVLAAPARYARERDAARTLLAQVDRR